MALPKNDISTATRRTQAIRMATLVFAAWTASVVLSGCGPGEVASEAIPPGSTAPPTSNAASPVLVADGKQVFRFDTMGNEQLWTDKLRLHEVVEKNVDPTTALKVGLKVDADVLPAGILEKVDLKSPATTVALLKMNAIVGIQAKWTPTITSRKLVSPARFVTPPLTTRLCPESATGRTAGRTGT